MYKSRVQDMEVAASPEEERISRRPQAAGRGGERSNPDSKLSMFFYVDWLIIYYILHMYNKHSSSRQHWDKSKTGGLAKLVD